MRFYLFVLLALVTQRGLAQQEKQQQLLQHKMQAINWLVGKWQGPVYFIGGDGSKREFIQTEIVETKLKNSILMLNEAAFLGQDTVFQNIVILGFDMVNVKYTLRAYDKAGGQLDADVEVQGNVMIWTINFPGHVIRYTIRLNEKGQWHQIGEGNTNNGEKWIPFFESTLNRIH